MAHEEVAFSHTVEGLFFKALRPEQRSPRLKRLCREAGIDLDRQLLPAYPRPQWRACLKIAAAELYPEHQSDQACRLLGQTLLKGYEQTFMGRAVLAMVRLLGPKRTLARMTHNFQSGNNYSTTRLTELAAGHFELWVNEPDIPHYVMGVVEAGLSFTAARGLQLALTARDEAGATLSVKWEG